MLSVCISLQPVAAFDNWCHTGNRNKITEGKQRVRQKKQTWIWKWKWIPLWLTELIFKVNKQLTSLKIPFHQISVLRLRRDLDADFTGESRYISLLLCAETDRKLIPMICKWVSPQNSINNIHVLQHMIPERGWLSLKCFVRIPFSYKWLRTCGLRHQYDLL